MQRKNVISYIIKRLLWAIPTLLGVSVLVFSMVHLAPGDPALVMLGEHANKEAVDALREQMGLNKPLLEQYFLFITNAVQGDFGISIISGEPVIDEFADRFPATVELSIVALTFATIVGLFAGIISAVKRYSWFDYISMSTALAGVSMPVFWLGLMLIYFFSVNLGWSILMQDYEAFWNACKHLLLPAFALGTIPMAIIARMTRASMIEVMKEDYIRTAKAKGCTKTQVIMIHGLKNALMPVITVIGLMLGTLFAGAILTETTFSWPGIGKWLVNAVNQRDFPIIQSTTLIIATIFVIINIIVDLLYAVVNPKVRLS